MILGVIAGAVVAMLVVTAVEALGHGLFPAPPGIDPTTREDLAAVAARMPAGLNVLVLSGWALGALLGALVADRIARRGVAGYFVAALVAAGVVATVAMVPTPLWMQVGGLILPFAAGWAAMRLARVRF